jgi:hypothetical protein
VKVVGINKAHKFSMNLSIYLNNWISFILRKRSLTFQRIFFTLNDSDYNNRIKVNENFRRSHPFSQMMSFHQ